jgi:hypothetical protein
MKSVVAIVVLILSVASAFAPQPTVLSRSSSAHDVFAAAPLAPLRLGVVSSEHMDVLTTAIDQLQCHLQSSSQLLTDAATATSDQGGLWMSYLSLFKGALSAVHETIDQPLRNIGITQTWGVAIFLFTAGT